MNFASRKRSVRLGEFSAAFMVLSICSCTDVADYYVSAVAGQAAALPCKCPPDDPPYVVWQKPDGEHPLVINSYKKDDKTAPEYHNRTELKLNLKTGNCSLEFYSVRASDAGLYECYYEIAPLRHEKIHLEVTDIQPQGPSLSVQNTVVSSSVCGILLILIAAAAVFVVIAHKKRRQMNGAFIATSTRRI